MAKTPSTSYKRQTLSNKINEVLDEALTTPKKTLPNIENMKTPHAFRKVLKKNLVNAQKKIEDQDSDYSAEEIDSDNSTEASSSECEHKEEQYIRNTDMSSTHIRRQRTNFHGDFILNSEDYFSNQASTKVFTSDRTLDCLKTPRLAFDKMHQLIKTLQIPQCHEKAINDNINGYRKNFYKWMFLLDEGFSILLYGLGSKRNLLELFQKQMLWKHDVLVINGFFPSLSIKEILDNISNKLLELNVPLGNLNIVVDLIEEEMEQRSNYHLFLLINNIDGLMLRNEKAQIIMSQLATIKNIFLVATTDHINAPMLWNSSKLDNYNFSWWDVTTMISYDDETAYENSLLVQNSGSLALSSMKNVFQSLNTNAKRIYLMLIKYQSNNKIGSHYQGFPFKDLYLKCREAFLVSSDLALRAQLTEYVDHKMVKIKRSSDGTEYLIVPIDRILLQQFYDEHIIE